MKGRLDLHEEWGWGVMNEANEWLPLHPDDLTYFAEMKEKFDNFEARVLSSPEVEFEIIIHNKFTGKIIYAKLNPKEEPKQETLEEAAKNYAENEIKDRGNYKDKFICSIDFIAGADWQQERMYNEQDMIEFAEFVATYPDKNKNVNGEMLHAKSKYDGSERTIDLLKEFKKK